MTTQNVVKKRFGLALRRYIEADELSNRYQPYFGCTARYLRAFLQHQFTGQMNWNNFGTVWKIGHVVAASRFDQSKEGDLRLCWNWVNLRPVRDTSVRRLLSGIEARRILEWRWEFFKDNPAIGSLLERASQMADEEVQQMTDWSMFHGEQSIDTE